MILCHVHEFKIINKVRVWCMFMFNFIGDDVVVLIIGADRSNGEANLPYGGIMIDLVVIGDCQA
jgi:hypothetical protein